jgi:hypothetical protein
MLKTSALVALWAEEEEVAILSEENRRYFMVYLKTSSRLAWFLKCALFSPPSGLLLLNCPDHFESHLVLSRLLLSGANGVFQKELID